MQGLLKSSFVDTGGDRFGDNLEISIDHTQGR